MMTHRLLTLDETAKTFNGMLGGHVTAWRDMLEMGNSTPPLGRQFELVQHAGKPPVCVSGIRKRFWLGLEHGVHGVDTSPSLAIGSIEGSSFEIAANAAVDQDAGGRAVLELRAHAQNHGSPRFSPTDARRFADCLLYLDEICERRNAENVTTASYLESANRVAHGTGHPELDYLFGALGDLNSPTKTKLAETL